MLFGPIFEYFDPVDGEVPEHFGMEFLRVAKRSREILQERTREEIIEAGDTIDALIEATREERVGVLLNDIAQEAESGTEQARGYRFDTPAGALEWCIGRMDPAAVMDGQAFRWSELFAVQALALVAHGWEETHHINTMLPTDQEEIMLRNVGSYAVDAMEALAKAETLVRVEELEQNFEERLRRSVQDKVSHERARAAKKRHAPQNRVKQQFIRWYLENRESGLFQSRNQAADKFLRDLTEAERRRFQPTNAQRTLLDALRAHLRDTSEP